MTNSEYREGISIPIKSMAIYSVGLSIPLTALLTSMMLPISDKSTMALVITIFPACFLIIALGLKLTKRSTIKIQDSLQFSGKRAPTLIVSGGRDATKSYVPLDFIVDVNEVEYVGPWWNIEVQGIPEASPSPAIQPTFTQQFFALRTEGDEIPIGDKSVSGYIGEGLLVTYRAKTLTSKGEEHLWRLLFPTRHAAELNELLREYIG